MSEAHAGKRFPRPTATSQAFWEGCRNQTLLIQRCQQCVIGRPFNVTRRVQAERTAYVEEMACIVHHLQLTTEKIGVKLAKRDRPLVCIPTHQSCRFQALDEPSIDTPLATDDAFHGLRQCRFTLELY